MFSYSVMSEQEAMAERFQLLKEGEYDAVISASVDTMSSTGNPMMDMIVTVYDDNGLSHDVRDFLVFTKKMMWKVIHFANSAGVGELYQEGKPCSQVVINKQVRIQVGIDQGKEIPEDRLRGKPLGSRFPDKNKIQDYLKKEHSMQLASNESSQEDEDIPF